MSAGLGRKTWTTHLIWAIDSHRSLVASAYVVAFAAGLFALSVHRSVPAVGEVSLGVCADPRTLRWQNRRWLKRSRV